MDGVHPGASADVERAPLPVGIVCPDCGYDLRGSTSARCPECGFGLDVLRTRETLIPWSHRRELGWFKAYWKTVWLVLRSPKRLGLEMARAVSYGDSQSFRWVTMAHAYPPLLAMSILWCALVYIKAGDEWVYWLHAGLQVWALVLLILLPGLASYFFHPSTLSVERQNRALALSYYCWAPLAFTPLALLVYIPRVLLWTPVGSGREDLLRVVSGLLPLTLAALAYWSLVGLAKHTLHQRGWRGFLAQAMLELLSVGLALLLTLIPLGAFYLLVTYHSLR
jgi:hypothetical protein